MYDGACFVVTDKADLASLCVISVSFYKCMRSVCMDATVQLSPLVLTCQICLW